VLSAIGLIEVAVHPATQTLVECGMTQVWRVVPQ
jgi:hypothetical protein